MPHNLRYDLQRDPGEERDLAPELPAAVLAQLTQLMLLQREATGLNEAVAWAWEPAGPEALGD
jgi:hypothetical protein